MPDVLSFNPPRALDVNANGVPGARAFFYDSGTSTLRTVYADAACTVPHASPLVADAGGTFAAVFSNAAAIKVVVQDSLGGTLYTIDPCVRVPTTGAAASSISFTPTGSLPFDNVQAAIEGSVAAAASGFNAFGLGVTGSVALLANLDATTIATGQYRFDGTTTGTFPSGVLAADTGGILLTRETSGSAWMTLYHDATDRRYYRRMNASAWGAWREDLTANTGFAAGDLVYHNGTNLIRLAKGGAGQIFRQNDGLTAPLWSDNINRATAVATTSGTAIDFTGIPSWAKRITIAFSSVAVASNLMVQLGSSGGFVSTGYLGGSFAIVGSTGATTTTGFLVDALGNSQRSGVATLVNTTANLWSFGSSSSLATSNAGGGAGTLNLGATLDRIRFTSVSASTFTAGIVNVFWE